MTRDVAGIPTAVIGEAGEDGPVIAILGEYDALPGLSQEAGVAEPRLVESNGNGHGCGHNLLGSAALLAATAVKDYLAANGLKGRVRYYGCPAEEGGAAKGFAAGAQPAPFKRCRHRDLVAPGLVLGRQQAGIARQHPHRLHLHRPRLACGGGTASRAQRARRGRAHECGRELHARAHAGWRARALRHARRRRRRAERGAGTRQGALSHPRQGFDRAHPARRARAKDRRGRSLDDRDERRDARRGAPFPTLLGEASCRSKS